MGEEAAYPIGTGTRSRSCGASAALFSCVMLHASPSEARTEISISGRRRMTLLALPVQHALDTRRECEKEAKRTTPSTRARDLP
jgi:hypothetical protein